MNDEEIISRLRHCQKYHVNPYNLGDMGEVSNLIDAVCRRLAPAPSKPVESGEDVNCPVCGYYCLGKGGQGCIDKPSIVSRPSQPVQGEGEVKIHLGVEQAGGDFWLANILRTLNDEQITSLTKALADRLGMELCSRPLSVHTGEVTEAMRKKIEQYKGLLRFLKAPDIFLEHPNLFCGEDGKPHKLTERDIAWAKDVVLRSRSEKEGGR